MRSVLAYTAARLLLFAVAFGVLYLLGARGLLAAAIAVLVSGLVSYVLLSRQRDAVSSGIADRISRLRGIGARLEAGAAKEDQAQQAAAGRGGDPSPAHPAESGGAHADGPSADAQPDEGAGQGSPASPDGRDRTGEGADSRPGTARPRG
ncbi:DUF4229 domain-containing protein [Streptomonospora litoralis]|uniref:DUF4229 domain-containing protein n=1 Tax=Streptomonospora litoralis TaxID=2498135 RepID=A0A4P6Q5S3_9ACTN|nr:DUF4229 domain-containing protein [Streptomonospora litoralis]QBI56045.1 hypothetical protein EKD16_21450 [Streptomonospora litoralis]